MAGVQQKWPQRKTDAIIFFYFFQIEYTSGHRAWIVLPVIAIRECERLRGYAHAVLELLHHSSMLRPDSLRELFRCFEPLLGHEPHRR